MPIVRKLAPEEVETIENTGKGIRKLTEEQYDQFLAMYDLGDYGEAVLDADEKRLTVRNRFKNAATRRGVALQFIRTTGDSVRFKVVANNGHAAEEPVAAPEPEPEPLPIASDAPPKVKGRGGRKKKLVD